MLNAAFLVAVYFALDAIADRPGLFRGIWFLPGAVWLVPTVLLLTASLIRRRRNPVLAHIAVLAVGLFAVGDLRLNPMFWSTNRDFRVMTWNVANAPKGWDPIEALIVRHNPDILVLIEVYSTPEFEAMVERLGYHRSQSVSASIVLSREPIEETRLIDFEDRDGVVGGVLSRLTVRGQETTVGALHFSSFKADRNRLGLPLAESFELTHNKHIMQAATVLASLTEVRGPVILAGDFNMPPRGTAYRMLADHFVDAFSASGTGFGYTYAEGVPWVRIDYIFSRGFRPVRSFVPPGTTSDHHPVVADFRMQN
ncbi:MAG: endonuclease/exonuclease/phosphatase family protein [Fimbriimonadaceae bacterium]